MSKKIEYIKQAIFYAQQKPLVLAELIAQGITDVESGVAFSERNNIVKIPASGTVVETFSASAVSQFGDPMTGTIAYSLESAYEGVSIDSSIGAVTVQSTAKVGKFTVVATKDANTAKMAVMLV